MPRWTRCSRTPPFKDACRSSASLPTAPAPQLRLTPSSRPSERRGPRSCAISASSPNNGAPMRLKRTTAAAALAALALAAQAQAQQFTMKLSTPTINDVTHEWMKTFKDGVEKRSAGRIKVEIYPANQLGQIPRTVEGVALGTIEMTTPAVGFLIGLEPRFQVLDAPGLFNSVEHAQKVFTDPEVRKRLATLGAAKGVEPLFTFANGPLMLLSHKPVRAVEDLKAQKIRVPGAAPLHIEPFRALGVSP